MGEKAKKAVLKLYVFDCPVHGLEYGVHCFRASSLEHFDRWHVSDLNLRKPTDEEAKKIKFQMEIQDAV